MFNNYVRQQIRRYLTAQPEIIFRNSVPDDHEIEENIAILPSLGLYFHIPFCERICPYCPYNKEVIKEGQMEAYVVSVKKEIDRYAALCNHKPMTTFYIGGGTPTTMINKGLEEITAHIYKKFNMQCDIHMESHPNHLSSENLLSIERMGVKYLSIGIEALQDHHLKNIERPYNVNEAKSAIERAAGKNFRCLNIDYIFDLPGQTAKEVAEAAEQFTRLPIHQVATYPLFRFPYTRLGKEVPEKNNAIATMFRRRKLLKIIEETLYPSDYYRSSVWAFTKKGTEKYCSVTVPSYIGLGASGGSYLKDLFYVNTFKVNEYIKAMKDKGNAISLSLPLSIEMQMASWLYWRIYETSFLKSDFENRFHLRFDEKYGNLFKPLKMLGYLNNEKDKVTLSDRGTYWIHAFEDFFSIDYINKLWGSSRTNPWPEMVRL